MKTISPHSWAAESSGLLLDVRTPAEYEETHIDGSVLHPLSDLDARQVQTLAAGRPVHLLCRSGTRARQACETLERAGLSDLIVIEGGLQAWEAAGLPVVRGRKTISLERQVRIAAGLLVLTGVALGVAVHPGFLGLSAFVGGGLVFAGLTDWCGMGLLLARLPWNTRSCSAQGCAKPQPQT